MYKLAVYMQLNFEVNQTSLRTEKQQVFFFLKKNIKCYFKDLKILNCLAASA